MLTVKGEQSNTFMQEKYASMAVVIGPVSCQMLHVSSKSVQESNLQSFAEVNMELFHHSIWPIWIYNGLERGRLLEQPVSEYSELKHFPHVARKSHEIPSENPACTEVPCLWQWSLVHIDGMYRLPPSVCARNWKYSHAQPIVLNLF